MLRDAQGRRHRLPRYFYEVPSHAEAREIRLSTHFGMNEFIQVDLKEAPRLQQFPRHIPCAIRLVAFYLQRLREIAGASIHISVNGGYRSPAHKMAVAATPHMWGTAVDIYRVGSTILHSEEAIQKYNRMAEEMSDDWYVMPYGHELGKADDHVHLDLGYLNVVPREMSEDRMEVPQQTPRFAFEERRRGDRRRPAVEMPTAAEFVSSEEPKREEGVERKEEQEAKSESS